MEMTKAARRRKTRSLRKVDALQINAGSLALEQLEQFGLASEADQM